VIAADVDQNPETYVSHIDNFSRYFQHFMKFTTSLKKWIRDSKNETFEDTGEKYAHDFLSGRDANIVVTARDRYSEFSFFCAFLPY